MKTKAASGGRALTELRGQFRGISEAKMMDCLTKMGRDHGSSSATRGGRQGEA
ncbi:MAG: hypothetical protein WAV18_30690 [Roseiarcus sp.]